MATKIGAKTASKVPTNAMMSSTIESVQFEMGSGERFAVTRAAVFVPCDAKAKPPPRSAAEIVTVGSSWLVAA